MMGKRIYLCGGSTEATMVASFATRLKAAGHSITHNWMKHVLAHQANGGTDATLTQEAANQAADEDLAGVRSADILWLLFPKVASFGSGVEFGVMLERVRWIQSAAEQFPMIRAHVPTLMVSGNYTRSIFARKANLGFTDHEHAFDWLVPGDVAQ